MARLGEASGVWALPACNGFGDEAEGKGEGGRVMEGRGGRLGPVGVVEGPAPRLSSGRLKENAGGGGGE